MQKKSLNLQYSDETTYNWVYEIAGPRGLFTRIPIYKGWYIQKEPTGMEIQSQIF